MNWKDRIACSWRTVKENRIFVIVTALFLMGWAMFVLPYNSGTDESFAVATNMAIFRDFRFFIDSWNPLQLQSIVAAPFYALYFLIRDYVPLGTLMLIRLIYVIVRAFVTVYFYRSLRLLFGRNASLCAAALFFMYHQGSKTLDYKSMGAMAIILCVSLWIQYRCKRQTAYLLFLGLAISIATLAYPYLVLLFPFFLVALWKFGTKESMQTIQKWKLLFCVAVVCMFAAFITLFFICRGNDIQLILYGLKQILLSDDTHSVYSYGKIFPFLLVYSAYGIIAYIPLLIIALLKKCLHVNFLKKREHINSVLMVYWIIFFVFECILRIQSVSVSRLTYAFVLLFFWFPYFYKQSRSKNRLVYLFLFALSVVVQFSYILGTNQGIAVTGAGAIYAIMAELLMFFEQRKTCVWIISILLCCFFFFGIWVDDGGYSDIFQEKYAATEGAMKGIRFPFELHEWDEAAKELLDQYVTEEDTLLALNLHNSVLAYVHTKARVGDPLYVMYEVTDRMRDFYHNNSRAIPTKILVNQEYYTQPIVIEGANYEEIAEKDGIVLLERVNDSEEL